MNTLSWILFLVLSFNIFFISIVKTEDEADEILINKTDSISKGVLNVVFGSQSFRACHCKCGLPNEAKPNKLSSLSNALGSLGFVSLFGNRSRSLPAQLAEKLPVISEYEEEEEEKLIGGDLPDEKHVLPWLTLVFVDSTLVAGGVLISDKKVLTAATPLTNTSVERVVLSLGVENRCSGDTGTSNHSITEILANPQYDPKSKAHDLAILTLANIVNFGTNLVPICLPKIVSHFKGQHVTVASWGGPTPTNPVCRPRRVRLPILPKDECSRSVTSQNLLTADKDCLGVVGSPSSVCASDMGYPVQYRGHGGKYELIGIISGGNVCGVVNSTLQIRIQDHLAWIKLNTKPDCTCSKH